MAEIRRRGGLACAVVALIAVLGAWILGWTSPPELTAADARAFTHRALDEIGLDAIRVDATTRSGTYTIRGTETELDVWETSARVSGGRIELKVDREIGEAVFVDDVNAAGDDRLLSDEQFRQLGDFRTDPARERRLLRNIAGTVAGVVTAAVAVLVSRS
jgi:hypothetical protein